ncbi:hypothetical protein HDV02_005337 [Globomyces sp. JEL0801]|nr:hypothetical protein HDV02_005337 [Globomyces sp. JEL0801]
MLVESGMCQDVNFSYSKKRKDSDEELPNDSQKLCDKMEKLYVGHLPFNVSKRELDDLFGYLKDAENAVKGLHGYGFHGKRINVEFSNKVQTQSNSCLICGKVGHWAKECPDSKTKGMDVKSGKCFKCGFFGHLARFCKDQKTDDSVSNGPPVNHAPAYRHYEPPRYRSRSPSYRARSPDYPPSYYRRGRSPSPGPYDYYPPYSPPVDRYGGRYRDYPPERDYYRGRYDDDFRPRDRDRYYDSRDMIDGYRGDVRDSHRDVYGDDYRNDPRDMSRSDPRDLSRSDLRDMPRSDLRDLPRSDPRDMPRSDPRDMPRSDPREMPRSDPRYLDDYRNDPRDVRDVPINDPRLEAARNETRESTLRNETRDPRDGPGQYERHLDPASRTMSREVYSKR